MKTTILVAAIWASLALVGKAALGEKFFVVKIADFDRSVSYQVLTSDELKSLENQIAAELKVYPKALGMAKKAWEADADLRKRPFPSSAVSPRQVQRIGMPYTDRAKAEAKLEALLKHASEREEEERAKEAQLRKGLDKETVKKQKADMEARQELDNKAAQLLRPKVQELTGIAPAPAGASADK